MAKDRSSEFSSESATTLTTPQGGAGGAGDDRSFFGHPRGLSTLFFTEMWERFSYYGIRALLILFMTATVATGGLGFDVAKAGAIYGVFIGLVYMMALPGGWVADRIIGQRKAVFWGGVLIAAGNFSLVLVPQAVAFFYLGLLFIILGTGLLKPNVSAMVGELYRGQEGARRDAGFSIFYMGINLGALIAPLVAGTLGQKIEWRYGFLASGIGMVLGLIQYKLGGHNLGTAGLHADTRGAEDHARQKRNLAMGLGVLAVIGAAVYFLGVTIEQLAAAMTVLLLVITLAYFAVVLAAGGLTREEKGRVGAMVVFFLAATMFWAGFEQAGSSLNLVAEKLTNLNVLGWAVPASWLQSVNPLFIIAFAPVFAWLWVWMSRRNVEPSSPGKFSIGLVLLGSGFLVMMVGSGLAKNGVLISPMWLIVTYLLHTCAELFLSPVGLSTVTKLAPHRLVGQFMGIWFMASALGNLVAGQVAGLIGAGEGGEISAAAAQHIFMIVAAAVIGFGLLLMLFVKPVRKLMHGVK